jgi:hypothetical protein
VNDVPTDGFAEGATLCIHALSLSRWHAKQFGQVEALSLAP